MQKYSIDGYEKERAKDPYLQAQERGVRDETVRRVTGVARAIREMYTYAKDMHSFYEHSQGISSAVSSRTKRKAMELIEYVDKFMTLEIDKEGEPFPGDHVPLLKKIDDCYDKCRHLYKTLEAFSREKGDDDEQVCGIVDHSF